MKARSISITNVRESDFSKEDLMNAVRQAKRVDNNNDDNNRRRSSRSSLFSGRSSTAASCHRHHHHHRALIAPSNRHFQLMREISGLGMDDPMKKNKVSMGGGGDCRQSEDGNRSRNNNSFNERATTSFALLGASSHYNNYQESKASLVVGGAFNDSFSMDSAASIASDPTATFDGGIDLDQFEKSLSHFGFDNDNDGGIIAPVHLSDATKRELQGNTKVNGADKKRFGTYASKNASSPSCIIEMASEEDFATAPTIDLEASLASLDVEDVMNQLNRNEPLNAENSVPNMHHHSNTNIVNTSNSADHSSFSQRPPRPKRKSSGSTLPMREVLQIHPPCSTATVNNPTTTKDDNRVETPLATNSHKNTSSSSRLRPLVPRRSKSNVGGGSNVTTTGGRPVLSSSPRSPRRSKSSDDTATMMRLHQAAPTRSPRRSKSSDDTNAALTSMMMYQAPRALGEGDDNEHTTAAAAAANKVAKVYGTKSRNMPNIATLFPDELNLGGNGSSSSKKSNSNNSVGDDKTATNYDDLQLLDHQQDKFVMSSRNNVTTPVFYQKK